MAKQTVKVEVNLNQELFDRIDGFVEVANLGGYPVNKQQVFDEAFNNVVQELLRQVDAGIEHYKKTGKILHGAHTAYTSKN